ERKLESNQSGPSILMVEDNKYVALALKIRFQKQGYDVSVASTVSEGLASGCVLVTGYCTARL
ncbi:MAG: ActR/RegA family two-component response regulator, partial [Gammaproteobacteria bacterium]